MKNVYSRGPQALNRGEFCEQAQSERAQLQLLTVELQEESYASCPKLFYYYAMLLGAHGRNVLDAEGVMEHL